MERREMNLRRKKSVCTKNRDHEYDDDDTANMYNRHGCMARLFVSIYIHL